MYIKRMFFPGEFDEAYIYMQKLLLFNADGSLFYVDLDHVSRYLEERYDTNVKSIPTHLFARNDWLTGERFESMFTNVFLRNTFLDALGRFPDDIEMDTDKFVHSIGDTNIKDLLDVTIYNRRVYMGTDNGTFHLDLEWKKNEVEIDAEPEKRHDAMCTQVNAKYGSVSISCGDDGLFTRFDDFGRLGDSYRSLIDWREVTDKSLRTSWLFEDLLNYTSATEPVLFRVRRSDKELTDTAARTREKVAVGFEGNPTELDYLLGGVTNNQALFQQQQSLLFLHNTSKTFLAQTQERTLFEIPVKHEKDQVSLVASQPKYLSGNLSSRILDVTSVRHNLILELYDSVQLLTGGQIYRLVEGEALSIKSYPYSKRFQNLMTVVVETGVYVVSLFDERELG